MLAMAMVVMMAGDVWGQFALETPAHNSYASGKGMISGWVCSAWEVRVQIFQHPRISNGNVVDLGSRVGNYVVPYGGTRGDTRGICGDDNNGFGMVFNWNLLGDGFHMVALYINREPVAAPIFYVSTFGSSYLRKWATQYGQNCFPLRNFPSPGEPFALGWQESLQNFVVVPRCQ